MSPKGEPQMHQSLAQSLQQGDEDQYDDDGCERDGEEGGGPDVRGENLKWSKSRLFPDKHLICSQMKI